MTAEILEPRRRPTQDRSRAKFELLLRTSRDLLLDVGFESFTCEEVSQRAGLPTGTLYQYFANKYVIVCELDRQDAVAVHEELTSFSEMIPSLDWLRFLDRMIDHMARRGGPCGSPCSRPRPPARPLPSPSASSLPTWPASSPP